jgi:hypothetical protein
MFKCGLALKLEAVERCTTPSWLEREDLGGTREKNLFLQKGKVTLCGFQTGLPRHQGTSCIQKGGGGLGRWTSAIDCQSTLTGKREAGGQPDERA